MNHYLNAMRNSFNFNGRASRKEFWLYNLFLFIIGIIALTLDGSLDLADGDALVFTGIVSIVHLLPSIAVSVRRLHDIDKSGWWLLLSFIGIGVIVLVVFFCLQSTQGTNRFGQAPDGANNGPYSGGAGQGQSQGAHHPQHTQASPQTAPNADPLDQLNKLKALHDSGTIDDAEFAKMKAELMSKVS